MKIGYFGFNMSADADRIARALRTADQAGYESVWTGEHVVLIDPQRPPSPAPPETPMLDTIAALAFAAGVTERVKLASGIILLPQRNPVVLAKELAGIDVLSKGRLLVGIGVGYVEGEFDAIGIPYDERGPRTTEHIDAMRAMWTEKPEFTGQFTRFHGIQSRPLPVQPSGPPIIVGGRSAPAYRRAVTQGDGWYGFALSPSDAAECLHELEQTALAVERPAARRDLEITITPPGAVDRAMAEQYEELGVSRLALLRQRVPIGEGDDPTIVFLEKTAEDLGLG